MFSTIVVGTDGSPDATCALAAVAEIAKMNTEASVHVVTAHHPIPPSELKRILANVPEDIRPLIHAQYGAEEDIAAARDLFEKAGVEAEFHAMDSDPTEAILESAEMFNADLIVVGSRGQGLAKRALNGSVSTKVVHHAPCAVLVVKDD